MHDNHLTSWNALSRLRTAGRAMYERYAHVGPLSEHPYATHVPVLVALALLVRPRRILEFGSGVYSTSLFLDAAIFPDTESVTVLENDAEWYARLQKVHGDDPRLHAVRVEGTMAQTAGTLDCTKYNLIFVDDSTSEQLRANTIAVLSSQAGNGHPIVIHDFQVKKYRWAGRRLRNRFVFTALTPQTCVACLAANPSRDVLASINELIAAHSHSVCEENAKEWQRIFLSNRVQQLGSRAC